MSEPVTEATDAHAPTREGTPPTDVNHLTPPTLPPGAGPVVLADFVPTPDHRFTVVRDHAMGGLGKVSIAYDGDVHRQVAFKTIRPDRDSLAARLRFINEAEITGQLEHPGIVPIYAANRDAHGKPYYAMRFIEGTTFAQAIAAFHDARGAGNDAPVAAQSLSLRPQFSSLSFRKLLNCFIDVCQTLAFAHSKGVIHRDVKPANVLLGEFGETLVVDWGLAKRLNKDDDEFVLKDGNGRLNGSFMLPASDGLPTTPPKGLTLNSSDLTQAGQILGTPAYMSPEQAAGEVATLGPATDIYALGVILYEMLTGQLPYPGDFAEIVAARKLGPPPPPTQLRGDVPRALQAVAAKAMQLKPEDRYATAGALAKDVERWLADEPVGAWREPWDVRARRWVRSHQTLATSLVLTTFLLTLGAIAGTYQWRAAEWEQRQLHEEKLRTLRQTATSQEELGMAALRANRWQPAADIFHEAAATLQGEPELADLHERMAARAARTRSLVRYRQFEQQMAEAIVFDDENEAMSALTKALDEFQTLKTPRWWEALPDVDLTPRQQELLRVDVHGHLLVLASLRARQGFMNVNNPERAREGCSQALELLGLAQAFVPTVTGDTVAAFCRMRLGQFDENTRFDVNRRPEVFADHLFLGMVHLWLGEFNQDPVTRFFLQSIKSPLLDLKTPLETAERSFRTSIATYPDYAWTYALLVDTLVRAKKPTEAELAARTHAALVPDDPMAQRLLAVTLLRQADRAAAPERKAELEERALVAANRIVELGGERWQTYLMRGVLRLEADRYQEAIADLERSRDLSLQAGVIRPRQYEVYSLLGKARLKLGHHAQAIEAYTEAIQRYPKGMELYGPFNHATLYENRADTYLEQKNYPAAEADYAESIRLSPDADGYHARAEARIKMGHCDGAIEDANQCIRLEPKAARGYLRRAEAHLRQGQLNLVLPDCDKALSLNAKATLANEYRGRVCALRGDWAAAATEFRAILKQDPRLSAGYLWLGLTYLAQGDLVAYGRTCTEAMAQLDKTRDHDQATDVVQLCSFAGGGDAQRVLALAERTLQQRMAARDRLTLGMAYLRANRLDEAAQCLQEGYPTLREGKPWVVGALFRGLCATKLGQPSAARPWIAAATQWRTQFLEAVAVDDYSKAPRFDSQFDWQSRILVEAILKEVGETGTP